jgi:hypothetical protein
MASVGKALDLLKDGLRPYLERERKMLANTVRRA